MLIEYDWINGAVVPDGKVEEWWALVLEAYAQSPLRVFQAGTEVMLQRARVAIAEKEIPSLAVNLPGETVWHGFNEKGQPIQHDFWQKCPNYFTDYICRMIDANH